MALIIGLFCLLGFHKWPSTVVNIALSPDEAKTVKFLEDSVKKTLKKLLLKATRKGKALSEEVP